MKKYIVLIVFMVVFMTEVSAGDRQHSRGHHDSGRERVAIYIGDWRVSYEKGDNYRRDKHYRPARQHVKYRKPHHVKYAPWHHRCHHQHYGHSDW